MQIIRTTSPLQKLLAYPAHLARMSESLFVVASVLVALAFSEGIERGLLQLGVKQFDMPELLRYGVPGAFVMTVVAAPIIETFLLQHLPITWARLLGARTAIQFAAGSLPFAVLHFDVGASGIAAGITGGFILTMAYLTFMPQSKTKAFWMTAAIHALYNLVGTALYVSSLPS